MKILVFNAGSSSHKSNLYEVAGSLHDTPPQPLWEAQADWSEKPGKTALKIQANGQTIKSELATDDRAEVIKQMLQTLWSGKTKVINHLDEIDVVGHRVVHGGANFTKSIRIDQHVQDAINKLAEFAPLHNPANLAGITAIEQIKSTLPQIAVFDTAFHSHLPREVQVYPALYAWYEQGIRRYGFHGISHQYCARRSAQLVGKDQHKIRLINCHLGNGCSLAAISHGHSIDTTMGFTPLEGLMMGTRSGSIDPSILMYLEREKGYTADKLEQVLNKESGLKGISGVSSDLRLVEDAIKAGNERAQLALDIFIYRLRYFIGAMLATLGGVDVLTFTGGIGENDAMIRAKVCENFAFLHLKLNQQANDANPIDQEISSSDSAVHVLVIHTEEDWEIARECWQLMQ